MCVLFHGPADSAGFRGAMILLLSACRVFSCDRVSCLRWIPIFFTLCSALCEWRMISTAKRRTLVPDPTHLSDGLGKVHVTSRLFEFGRGSVGPTTSSHSISISGMVSVGNDAEIHAAHRVSWAARLPFICSSHDAGRAELCARWENLTSAQRRWSHYVVFK